MPIVARTKAENEYVTSPAGADAAPSRATTTPATSAATVGHRSARRNPAYDVRLHASSGPMPMSSSSGSPKARRKKLKYGGPTVTASPRTASDTTGKTTPQSTVRHSATSKRLL